MSRWLLKAQEALLFIGAGLVLFAEKVTQSGADMAKWSGKKFGLKTCRWVDEVKDNVSDACYWTEFVSLCDEYYHAYLDSESKKKELNDLRQKCLDGEKEATAKLFRII